MLKKIIIWLIIPILSLAIIGVATTLFLNKVGIIDINSHIQNIKILESFLYKEFEKIDPKDAKIAELKKNIEDKKQEFLSLNKTYKQLKSEHEVVVEECANTKKELEKFQQKDKSYADLAIYYSSMKDKIVGQILNSIDDKEIVKIFEHMDNTKVSKILENLSKEKAVSVSKLFFKK